MKIAVLGGGISGLVSAHSLKDIADVTVVSPELGGTWASGGLKVLKWHPWLEHLMLQLGVPFFLCQIEGAVWWKKMLLPLSQVDETIQRAHYKRSRGTMEGFSLKCMNEKAGAERTIDFDYNRFVAASKAQLKWVKGKVIQVYDRGDIIHIDTTAGVGAFDYVITTLPLWVMRNVADFHLPVARYCKLFVAEVSTRQPLPKYHYVYLPKGDGPHRISSARKDRSRWTMEVQSTHEPNAYGWTKLIKPVQELMPDARLGPKRATIPGHILPLKEPLEYPERILSLGRFASWDSRETVDKSVEKVLRFATGLHILNWR
jgi:hypothetical protein